MHTPEPFADWFVGVELVDGSRTVAEPRLGDPSHPVPRPFRPVIGLEKQHHRVDEDTVESPWIDGLGHLCAPPQLE